MTDKSRARDSDGKHNGDGPSHQASGEQPFDDQTRVDEVFQTARELVGVGGFEVDTTTGAFTWSRGLTEFLERDEPIPDLFETLEYVHSADRAHVEKVVEETIAERSEFSEEFRVVTEEARERWLRMVAKTAKHDGTVYLQATFQDVTDERESAQQHETLLANLPDCAVVFVDETMTCRLAGGKLFEQLPVEVDEVRGTEVPVLDIATDEDIKEAYRTALTGEETTLETTLEEQTLQIRVVPVDATDSGNASGALAVVEDITERKAREREVERVTRAADVAPTGVVMTDATSPENPMIYANERFKEITGYSEDEILGRNCRFLQGEKTEERRAARLRQAVAAGESATVELRNYTKDGEEFWNRVSIAPVENDAGEIVNYVGFQQDVTERRRREEKLRTHDRRLRELQKTTQTLLGAQTRSEIAEHLDNCLTNIVESALTGVFLYDEQSGVLQTVSMQSADLDQRENPIVVEPGENAIWDAYAEGETKQFAEYSSDKLNDVFGSYAGEKLVIPIGDYGVMVAVKSHSEFDDDTIDLLALLAASGQTTFERRYQRRQTNELAQELQTHQSRVEELEAVMDSIKSIQQRISESNTREAMEAAVCEELVTNECIEFAWIGHPKTTDEDLSPAAWAGDERGYLDKIDLDSPEELPAQRAAQQRKQIDLPNLSHHARGEDWAKIALSCGYESVMSLPVVYDEVLYGVLTAYSGDADVFSDMYAALFEDIVSLLGNYTSVLGQSYTEAEGEYTEFEFELEGPEYPLQMLSVETEAIIRFDTVVEVADDYVGVALTVIEGDVKEVLATAQEMAQIQEAGQFGDKDSRQLTLTVERPFLPSKIQKHGGRLVKSLSDGDTTRLLVQLPGSATHRPLMESLAETYQEIELVSRQRTDDPDKRGPPRPEELLTDRQYEVLKAAYHGGYYETPRGITGEELAESLDISGPAVYDHLQAAHRTLLDSMLE